jgi:hypothetical protein
MEGFGTMNAGPVLLVLLKYKNMYQRVQSVAAAGAGPSPVPPPPLVQLYAVNTAM